MYVDQWKTMFKKQKVTCRIHTMKYFYVLLPQTKTKDFQPVKETLGVKRFYTDVAGLHWIDRANDNANKHEDRVSHQIHFENTTVLAKPAVGLLHQQNHPTGPTRIYRHASSTWTLQSAYCILSVLYASTIGQSHCLP
jgi:hypothetical protein